MGAAAPFACEASPTDSPLESGTSLDLPRQLAPRVLFLHLSRDGGERPSSLLRARVSRTSIRTSWQVDCESTSLTDTSPPTPDSLNLT